MEFLHRAVGQPRTLGVLAGAFNPLTAAHVALAAAAVEVVDEVLLALPRGFPHKQWHGLTLDERARELRRVASARTRWSAAVTDGQLFVDIASECLAAYGAGVAIWMVCGRDTAERIATWDYGVPGEFEHQLEQYGLLVAPRAGPYTPDPAHAHRIRSLTLDADWDAVSSSTVRRLQAAGEPWQHLVPEE